MAYDRVKNPVPRATQSPTVCEIAWAAGFIEGEGTFYRLQHVTAVQVQREPLERLQRMFGGRLWIRNVTPKPMWSWRVTGARARGVMFTIWPWMSPKRKREIRQVLANWRTRRGVKARLLTPAHVRTIKAAHQAGRSRAALATEYGVSTTTIFRIVHGTYVCQQVA